MVEFRLDAFLSSLHLICGFAIISSIGCALTTLLGGRWTEKLRPLSLIWAFAVGQVGITTYYYIRSLLSHLSATALGIPLIITQSELWGIALLLTSYSLVSLRRGARLVPHDIKRRISYALALDIFTVWLVLFGISTMELPREIMLSSDPDLHAFWAAQVARLHEVPWHQGLWGPGRFSYPTGFAVLNYLWSTFSGLSIPSTVTAQPLIQTQLSLALLAWAAWRFTPSQTPSYSGHTLIFSLLMVVYYVFLPYGYQHSHLHLEGTGRIAAPLFSALIWVSSLVFLREAWRRSVTRADAVRFMLFGGCVITFLGFINPATLFIPSCLFGCAVACYLLIGPLKALPGRSLALLSLLGPIFLLLCADPYYFDILGGGSDAAASHNAAVPAGQKILESVGTSLQMFIAAPLDSLATFFSLDLLAQDVAWKVFVLIGVAYATFSILGLRRSSKHLITDALLALLVGCLVLAYFTVLLPCALALATHPRGGLLYPYLIQSLQQNMFLVLTLCIAIIASRITTLSRWWICVGCVALLIIPMKEVSTSSAMVTVKPRYAYSGSMGDFTPDDKKVITFIREFSSSIFAKYPSLDAQSVPKILIPNDAIVLNQEEWLFSFGGARSLPFEDTLPVAFYYSQGDPEQFSWAAYKKNVCEGLNRPWMSRRNIRYVFIPTQIAGQCAVNLRKDIRESDVIFRSGEALFAKIN